MSEQKRFTVRVETEVEIVVENPNVIERITGPGGDDWRRQMYNGLHTEEDVLKHLAAAGLITGASEICALDGWADLPPSAGRIEVVSTEAVEVESA
jgi:hypothetical protein